MPKGARALLSREFAKRSVLRNEISRLRARHAGLSCRPIEETALDWRYPVRILATRNAAEMHGPDYMLIRNRVRQTQKYRVDVRPLSPEHIAGVEDLSRCWAARQAQSPREMADLVTPYSETLRLFKQKSLTLDGLAFIVDGVIQGAAIGMCRTPSAKRPTCT